MNNTEHLHATATIDEDDYELGTVIDLLDHHCEISPPWKKRHYLSWQLAARLMNVNAIDEDAGELHVRQLMTLIRDNFRPKLKRSPSGKYFIPNSAKPTNAYQCRLMEINTGKRRRQKRKPSKK